MFCSLAITTTVINSVKMNKLLNVLHGLIQNMYVLTIKSIVLPPYLNDILSLFTYCYLWIHTKDKLIIEEKHPTFIRVFSVTTVAHIC